MACEPVLLIHGGATDLAAFPDEKATAASLDRIAREAGDQLDRGSSALQAVAFAVAQLEDDPLFNAGYGSKLQADGCCRLSASAMDGSERRFAAVINVQDLWHPSQLALHLLGTEDRILDGEAADALARELGLPRRSPVTERRLQDWKRSRSQASGTVGAVALDRRGHLAALTSTGGKGNERPGRVSDSATPAGNYADRHLAVSCTGIGEHIVDLAVAPRLATWVEMGLSLPEAADRLVVELNREDRRLGFIAVDADGTFQARTSTQCMAYRAWKGTIVEGWPGAGD